MLISERGGRRKAGRGGEMKREKVDVMEDMKEDDRYTRKDGRGREISKGGMKTR